MFFGIWLMETNPGAHFGGEAYTGWWQLYYFLYSQAFYGLYCLKIIRR